MLDNTPPSTFLDQEPEELELFLLRIARQEVAPTEARERTLLKVASAAAGVGFLAGSSAFGTGQTMLKATGWLAAKWLVVGVGSGLMTIAVAQGVSQLASGPAPGEPAQPARAAAPKARHASAPPLAGTLGTPITPTSDAPAAEAPAASSAVPRPVFGSAAPDPSTRAPRVVEAAPAPESTLTRELGLLEQARGALTQRSPTQAQRSLDAYALAFPGGALQVEAAALRVEAVGQSGNRALATQLAEAFLSRYPTSPLAARVRGYANMPPNELEQP